MYPTFKERFLYVLSVCDCSKSKAAEKLNVSPAYISQLCSGVREPSDRTISDICRIFNVNPAWMRHGEEPIFAPDRDNDAELIDRFMEDSGNPMRDLIAAIIKTYMQCGQKDKEALKNFAASLSENIE